MTVTARKIKRTALFVGVGVVIGLAFSFLSGQLGSSCTIMCNPYIAGSLGGVMGAVWSMES